VKLDPELQRKLIEILEDERRVARAERRAIARLEVDTREAAILVPELDVDVHDLRGLARVGELLFAGLAATRRQGPRERARVAAPTAAEEELE
jgi:hypothetical protein